MHSSNKYVVILPLLSVCTKMSEKIRFFLTSIELASNEMRNFNRAQIAWFKCQPTYLVVYKIDDWQNNRQGHHNLCKKRPIDKDKSLLGATDIVFTCLYGLTFGPPLILPGSCYLLEFAFRAVFTWLS